MKKSSNFSGVLVAHLIHQHNGTEITNIFVKGDWVEFKIAPVIAEWIKQRNSGPHNFTVKITKNGTRVSCTQRSSVTITTSTRS